MICFLFSNSLITQSYRDVKTLPELHLCEKDLTKEGQNYAQTGSEQKLYDPQEQFCNCKISKNIFQQLYGIQNVSQA